MEDKSIYCVQKKNNVYKRLSCVQFWLPVTHTLERSLES